MKGQISTGLKVTTLLLASVAFGFAQTSSMSAPGAYPQYPNAYNQGAYSPPPRQVAPVGPGTVNYVEGQVSLNGQNLTTGSIGSACSQARRDSRYRQRLCRSAPHSGCVSACRKQ